MNKERGKKIIRRLFFLSPGLTLLVSIPAFLLVIFTLVRGEKQTEKYTLLIEAKYDEIYEICGKGNKLLY